MQVGSVSRAATHTTFSTAKLEALAIENTMGQEAFGLQRITCEIESTNRFEATSIALLCISCEACTPRLCPPMQVGSVSRAATLTTLCTAKLEALPTENTMDREALELQRLTGNIRKTKRLR